jgi:predicted PurR-regulated permease PerM
MNQPLRNDIPRTTLAALFAGIIGGLLAFGLVGLFVGPVVLAVAYTLLDDWTHAATSPASGAPGDDGARAVGHERAST